MINISKNTTFILQKDGSKIPFCKEKIYRDLQESFRLNSVNEDWIAEDLSMMIEEYIRQFSAAGNNICSAEQLDNSITRILLNLGFRDVANTYAGELKLSPTGTVFSEKMDSWTTERIIEQLAKNPLFLNNNLKQLAKKTTDALNKLGLKRISDQLIDEISVHLLFAGHEKNEFEENPLKRILIFSRKDIQKTFPEESKEYFEKKIFVLHSVNTLFPKIHIKFSIAQFAKQLFNGSDIFMDLSFFPAYRNACNLLTKCFVKGNAILEKKFPLENKVLRTFLELKDLEPEFTDCYDLKAKQKERILNEIYDIAETNMSEKVDFALKIT
ncbi:MAG: hypothetical protein U9O87_10415 [Verrucomicrobiota bacterium]|nr:hypothetical protein [Verrucomicrobiota bacterium]